MSEAAKGTTSGAADLHLEQGLSLAKELRELIPATVSTRCPTCRSKTRIALRRELGRMNPAGWSRLARIPEALDRERANREAQHANELSALSAEVEALRGDVAKRDDDIEQRTRRISRLEQDVAELRNKIDRLEEVREYDVERARDNLVEAILPIFDSIDRAMELADEHGGTDNPYLEGIRMMRQSADSALARTGYAAQRVLHESFDATKHSGVSTVETSAYPAGTIVGEIRRGYVRIKDGKPVRHAEVAVAVAPATERLPDVVDEDDG